MIYAEHNHIRERFIIGIDREKEREEYLRFCKLTHDGLYLAMVGQVDNNRA